MTILIITKKISSRIVAISRNFLNWLCWDLRGLVFLFILRYYVFLINSLQFEKVRKIPKGQQNMKSTTIQHPLVGVAPKGGLRLLNQY